MVFAIALLPVLAGPATAGAALPLERSTATAAATSKAPRAATRAIRCASTVSSTGRLTPAQRAQVRRFGAYQATRKVGRRTAKVWICVRTAAQAKVVRSLTRSLGASATDTRSQAVSFPRTLDGELTIALPDGDSAGWRMVGAPKVPVQSFDRGAVYSTTEYDVVQKVGFGSLKESIAVHRRQGVRTWSWRLEWDGGKSPFLAADGTIRYGNDVVIAKPFLQDTRGRRLRDLSWTLDGDVLSVKVDDRRLALPYVIDPASSYPQRIHPENNYVTGSTAVQGLIAPPLGAVDTASGAPANTVGDVYAWSGNTQGFWAGGVGSVTDASRPNPVDMGGITPCDGANVNRCYGALGWAQEALGGATLAAGPYTMQAELDYVGSGGGGMPFVTALKARLWKVKFAPETDILSATPLTNWATSPAQSWTGAADANKIFSVTAAPLSLAARQLAPDDHVYIEYVFVITDGGQGGSTIRVSIEDPDTFIDFGGPAINSPGVAANLRLNSPLTAAGWTTDSTPNLRATLDDPDWWHHNHYQVCTDAACTAVVQQGNSPANQMIGSTNDQWTVPAALADGFYYMRARTEEDGGDLQIGTYNNFTGTTCTVINVGACGRFGVDGTLPNGAITSPATGTWNRGTVTVSGTSSDTTSGVVSHSLQWRRISPAPAGPSATGIACAGASTPAWSCTWNTTAVIDGDYELQLTVTDAAGNVRIVTSSTYRVDNTAPAWPGGSFWRDGLGPGDIQWTNSNTTLSSHWTGATDANTVTTYEYCLSTSISGADCGGGATKTWTNNALVLSQTSAGLTLAEGGTYYSCVRAYDPAGNTSTVQCSDGQRVDTLPPTAPTVNDGAGPGDITWNVTATGTMSGNWAGGGDVGSGINRWEYCYSTSSTGADCAGAALRPWTTNGVLTTVSVPALLLVEGQQYFVCVRGFDNAGSQTPTSPCSNGQRVDRLAPPIPPSVADGSGADVDIQNNGTTINANWPAVIDPVPGVGFESGLQRYQYCITTSSTGANCGGGAMVVWTDNAPLTGTTLSRSGLTLVDAATYYVCIRTNDVALNATGTQRCSDGVLIDGIPPTWSGTSRDGVGPGDIAWTTSATTLSSNWSVANDPNGIDRYEYCLSTTPAGADCAGAATKPWTTNGTLITETSGGLTLVEGGTYYSCVRAFDTAGNMTTPPLCSNGQRVDTIAPTMPPAVNDGTAADIDWLQSLTTASANWPGGSDATSGVDRWEYCISTAPSCGGTVAKTWTTAGTTTTQTSGGLALVQGENYFTTVRGYDVAGNGGVLHVVSDAQRVDTVAPPAPATINDGLAADLDFSNSATTLSANWTGVIDPPPGVGVESGLAKFQYCITTTAGGADCGGGATLAWTDNAPLAATTFTRAGLALVNGTTYRVCIRAHDVATNAGVHACTDGITIDLGPPTWLGTSRDGAGPGDVAWTTSTTTLLSNWDGATDPAGIDHYEYCLTTSATGADCAGAATKPWTANGLALTQTSAGLTLTSGTMYYSCVRAFDGALNVTTPPLCSNGQRVDSVPPVLPPAVLDGTAADLTWLQSLTTASANWPGGSDPLSGIASWEYCISTGTACSGTIIKNWTNNAASSTQTSGGLALVEGQLYYTTVRGTDVAGNITPGTVSSNGQRVDTIAPPATPPVNDGTGADVSYSSSATQISANWTTVTDPVPGVGVESGLDRFQYCITTVAAGTNCAGGATVVWTDMAPLTSTALTRTGLALTNGTTYYVCVRSHDVATNASTRTCSNGNTIDIGPPAASWTSWTEPVGSESAYLHSPGGSLLWFNPAPAGPADAGVARATVTATDPGAGMDRVDFPNLAAGAAWGAGGSDTTVGPVDTWIWDYTFAGTGAIGDPAINNATAFDTGGAFTGAPTLNFDIRPDSTPPTVAAKAAMPGTLQNTTLYTENIALGTDADSGVGRWVMDVQFAPLVDNVCGAWDPWTLGDSIPNYFGPGSNGAVLPFPHYLNDTNSDLVPDYYDSFCFRTQVRVYDNVDNMSLIPANGLIKVDTGKPDVAFTAPPNGSAQGGTFNITGTTDDEWLGVFPEYPSSGSGIASVAVTYESPDGPDAGVLPDFTGNACPVIVAFGGPWTAHTWSCSWNSTLPAMDGIYTIRVQATDRAGNVSTIQSRTYLIDNIAPVRAFHSWNDYGSTYMHSVGNIAWVNPTASVGAYQLDARVTATDAGSGVNRVEFPGLGAGWTPGVGVTNATFTSPVPVANAYTMAYTFPNPGALAAPGAVNATAFDGAGNSGTVPFVVRLDGFAPTGMTASVVNGTQTNGLVTVSMTSGADGALESGIGSWALLVDTAPLTNDTCGAWANGWGLITSGVGLAPASYVHDVTVDGSQCYRYRVEITDNVGNVGQSTPATARRVDMVAPAVAITAPATGSVLGGTFAISGTANDVHTGIDRVALTWAGPEAPGTGVICDPATLGGAYNAYTFSCNWNTVAPTAFDDGTYTITARSYDKAGNVSAVSTITVVLDNFPPFVGFHAFNETSQYTYWAGPIGTNTQLWYNPIAPAAVYSFDVLVNASDPSGINRVEYDAAGAGWTGGLPATQTVGVGPATRYSQTYTFNTAGAVADPPTLDATAFDPANNNDDVQFDFTPDSAVPATGTVTNPNTYNPSATIVVNVNSGGDGAGSGIQGWTLLRDTGTLSAGACIAWTGYTTTVTTGVGTVAGTRNDVVADGSCARYRLVVTDNVGNVGTFTGTDETKVDLTPPTGSITLSENTGTQWTYLATPSRMFVNTGAGTSGTFDANVTANAASGILDVTFPVLAPGFAGNGVMPGPGPNFVRTYSWTGVAGSPPPVLNAAVRSNSLGSLNLPFEVISDAAAPIAATVAHPGGFTASTALTINYTSGNDGTGSGIAGYQLQRETGTLAAGACTWTSGWLAAGPAGGVSYNDTLAHATCYRYRVAVTDNVGNVGYSPVSAARMVDTTAPTGASVTLTEYVNPAEQWVSAPDTIWVKAVPTGPANFNITVSATDAESGTGAAVFPALGSTFVYTSGGPFNGSYAWSPTALTPGAAPIVQVANGSGLTTTIPFFVNIDGAAPAGAVVDQENGLITDFMVDLSYTTGGDGAGSGIDTWRIERQSAPYTIGTDTCGVWTLYATYPLPLGQPVSPYVDTSVAQPTCYRYRLVEIDRVGNRTNTVDPLAHIAKVIFDITPPTAFSLNLPTNPVLPAITTASPAPACGAVPTYATTTPAFTWTPSSDAESGLSHYDVYVDGVGAPDATVAAPATTWTPLALTEGAHSLGVRALDFQANFRNADPAYPSNIQIDTTPPTGSLAAPAAGSWSGDTTPTLDWNATDATCLTRIEVFLDGAGAATAVASGMEGSWTPPAPLADGAHTWRFVAWDALGNSTSFGPYAFGIDTTPPTAFAVTAPTAGQTVRGFVNVTWSASSDLESGLLPAAAYQVYVDGLLKTTVAAGTTSANVPAITNGGHSVFVRAVDLVGNTRDTAPVLFTGYGAIPVPLLDAPADLSATNTVPLLDWHWPSDGGPPPTSYNVYLDGVNVGSQAHPTSQHTLAVDPGDGNHTWRIEQLDPYTGTVTSVTWSFVLDRTPPLVDATLTRVATTVSWTAPTDPALPVASGIDRQEFWIDPAGAPPATFTTLAALATSRDYGLLPDGVYSMWVRTYDRAGNSTDSTPLVVTNDSVPPTAFNLDPPGALPGLPAITTGPAAPTCETEATYTSATPNLTWQPSSDATSGLAGYDVYVDGALVTTTGPATTNYTLVAPLTGGTHTWRVVARDNFGLSRTSTPSPMNVRVDVTAPTVAYSSPTDNSYTSDTTPTFGWTAGDDNCLARIELTIGAAVYVLTGSQVNFTTPVALPEGPTTWSVRAFDSAGRITSAGAPRTINVDTTPPNGLNATFPGDTATVNEGMLTFSWTAGADAGSGVAKYDLIIDGSTVATNVLVTSNGTHQILGGAVVGTTAPHNWSVRAYDAVGNSAVFPFSFLALSLPDVTPPDPFDLLTVANGAPLPAGDPITWAPSWDFKGVTQYRVFIDGALAATVAGNVTTFTPAAGAGAPICTVNFDPAVSAGCLAGPTYGGVAADWNTTSLPTWSAGGNALGVGDQSLPITAAASGFDGNMTNTSVSYQTNVPASGGEVRIEHRYNTHMIDDVAFDGVTIELSTDGGGTWESACEKGAVAIYTTSIDCDHEIIEHDGAPNVVLGIYNSMARRNAFAGDSAGVVLTKLDMATLSGQNVIIRFVLASDACYTGMPAGEERDYCDGIGDYAGLGAPGYFPIQWRVDNVTLADSSLLPGIHTWRVQARDAAGNFTWSNQTWTFDLQP